MNPYPHASRRRPTVLVTGASRGIGKHITDHLAESGWTVFAAARRPCPADRPEIRPIPLDVTDTSSVTAAAAIILEEVASDGLTALVNNAAVLEAGPLADADQDCVDRHLRTNIAGPLAVTRAMLPMLRQAGGRIVNISSVNARLPLPYWGLYSATKAALDALSDSLRLEVAGDHIGVTVLTLGAFDTDIRRNGLNAWPNGGDDETRRKVHALSEMLDATAADPARVAEEVRAALEAPSPPARVAVGDGIDDLLALAAQPIETRDAAVAQLFGIDLQAPGSA